MASSTLVVVDRGIAFSMSSSIGANGPAVILLLSSDSVSLSDWRVVGLEVPRRGCAGDWSVGSMHGRTFERWHGRCPVVVRSRAGGVLGSLPAARLSRAPVGEETAPCPRGQRPFSTTADELVVIFHDGIGLQDREVSQLGLAEAMVAQALHDATDSGLGAKAPWEARSAPGRGGAGRHG